ncbi:MAG: DoxX family protein [Rhizobiaceae bacterium]|nr:DoxX family protein [Rhizobiaceae bacterium]
MPRDLAILLARLLLATVFVPNGLMKLSSIEGTAGYFAGLGLPLPLAAAWGSGLFELVAGLCIVTGFQMRIAALLLAAFCLVAGATGHLGQGGGDAQLAFMHMQALLKDIGLAGGFLALAVLGPGRWAIGRST